MIGVSWMKPTLALLTAFCLLLQNVSLHAAVYRVRRGDTLWGIARKFGVSVDRLRRLNRLRSNKLLVKQRLRIPDGAGSRSTGQTTRSRTGTTWYRVQRGDTIWSLCRRFGMSRKNFRSMNGLQDDTLRIGQRVRVPARPGSGVTAKKKRTRRSRPGTSGRWRWYRVRRGDALLLLAKRFHTSARRLERLNGKDLDTLYVGQRLKVPLSRSRNQSKRRTPSRKKYFARLPAGISRSFAWPVRGRVVEKFGIRSKGINHGITIRTGKGKQVRAARPGVVTFTGHLRGYGRVVILRHSPDIYTVYSHLARVLVRKGTRVTRGKILARTGWVSSARCHGLHFQIYYKTRPVNPLSCLG